MPNTFNRHPGEGAPQPEKNEGRTPQVGSTAKGTTSAANSTTPADPLIGWFSLGKESREKRRMKRTWKRQQSKQRGFWTPDFGDVAVICMTAVALAVVAWRAAP